ncbi:MATE family efflux transporter [Rhodospirillaceae bacterium SYSU D60014]|uniref:MATE family efflux transporter n=1 Tax=Virgifigura deserti TaxID=2268457 RepID=UPI000E67225F
MTMNTTRATTSVQGAPLAQAGFPLTIGQHIRRTLVLAVPVMFARAGLVIMVTVDTVMTGRAGAQELAYYGIGLAPQLVMQTIGIGLLVGTVVLSAQADGAGETERCGRIWRLALILALGLGLFYAVALLWGEGILLLIGQTPDIAAGGGAVLRYFALGMPAILIFIATSAFLEGISRPRAGMVVSLGANLVNAGLNWIFIFGHLGAPAMGAAGAALATSITRWLMVAALVGYVLTMRDAARFGVHVPLAGHWRMLRTLLLLGIPLAAAIGLETTAFAASTTFAGWMGTAPLAGFQIAFNTTALVYMLSIGLSTATAVRVANAIGRRDRVGLARAGWTGVGLAILLMLAVAVILNLTSGAIAAIYTDDIAVQAIAIPALGIVAWLVIADGAQGVLMGAMRGAGDVILPTAIYGLAFWGLAIPLAYGLGVAAGYGVPGLLWSLCVGLIVAMVLLALRFHFLSKQEIRAL